jgi:hypothetical protein
MDFNDYGIADTTKSYYYSESKEDTLNGIVTSVANKAELEEAIKAGKVYSYRVHVIKFYFPNKEQA